MEYDYNVLPLDPSDDIFGFMATQANMDEVLEQSNPNVVSAPAFIADEMEPEWIQNKQRNVDFAGTLFPVIRKLPVYSFRLKPSDKPLTPLKIYKYLAKCAWAPDSKMHILRTFLLAVEHFPELVSMENELTLIEWVKEDEDHFTLRAVSRLLWGHGSSAMEKLVRFFINNYDFIVSSRSCLRMDGGRRRHDIWKVLLVRSNGLKWLQAILLEVRKENSFDFSARFFYFMLEFSKLYVSHLRLV